MNSTDFAGLSDTIVPLAERAKALGLSLTHFNSGTKRHSGNGTRIFANSTAWGQHWRGDHIAHLKCMGEIQAFLDGYSAAIKRSN